MSYIATINEEDATGELADLYRRVGNPDGSVDSVMKIHSLSPPSLRAHFELYITAMHKPSPLSRCEREMIGAIVSGVNGCRYCLTHHAAGLRRLLPADRKAIADDLLQGREPTFSPRERAMAEYATSLARDPSSIEKSDIDALRSAGLDDRSILDLAQVVAYFCYANRIVTGLDAKLESFEPGQHPKL